MPGNDDGVKTDQDFGGVAGFTLLGGTACATGVTCVAGLVVGATDFLAGVTGLVTGFVTGFLAGVAGLAGVVVAGVVGVVVCAKVGAAEASISAAAAAKREVRFIVCVPKVKEHPASNTISVAFQPLFVKHGT